MCFSLSLSRPLEQDVDEEVDGGVEYDESVRDLLDDLHPGGPPARPADGHLVGGGDHLPDVAEQEEPHDGQRDARQAVLPPPANLEWRITKGVILI